MELEELINRVVEEALKRLREDRVSKRVILVSEYVSKQIKKIESKLSSYEVMKFMPGGVSVDEALDNIESSEAVVCLLSLSLAEKIGALDDSVAASRVVLRALLAGKRVYALTDDIEPKANAPKLISSAIDERLRRLRAFDVKVTRIEEFSLESEKTSQRKGLITEEDILAVGSGEIRVAKGCVITPLARDRAAELGIKIVVE
ncbi:MAG: hypothetical protein QXT63_07510 [Thermoplasmata archaeon]